MHDEDFEIIRKQIDDILDMFRDIRADMVIIKDALRRMEENLKRVTGK